MKDRITKQLIEESETEAESGFWPTLRGTLKASSKGFKHWWRGSRWRRFWLITAVVFAVLTAIAYGIGRWYIASQASKPFALGSSFIPSYARSLGLDPHQTLHAMLDDLQIKHLRYTSYWNEIESQRGTYNFTELDWQFDQAEKANAKISLSIGLRQPRWPECHVPDWAADKPVSDIYPDLAKFMTAVVNRYKTSPSLDSYQLENEYFLERFGTCTDFSRERLEREFKLVKRLDSKHPVILSRSNNFPIWPVGEPRGDIVGMSTYRRVWDGNLTKRYFTYPMPAWYFGFLAGVQKLLTGQESMLHELQAEAWPPRGQTIPETSLEEQNKTMNAERLQDTINYGKATGLPAVYLWSGEYWYYRKIVLQDPSLWETARAAFIDQAATTAEKQ